MNRYLLLFTGALAGCSSLVSDPCMAGYHLDQGACMPALNTHGSDDFPMSGADASTDGSTAVAPVDANPIVVADGPDPLVCALPTTLCGDTCVTLDDDPYNCGHCGRECQSGICSSGTCLGDIPGHIIVVGHDYVASDAAMDRVIGNAVSVGWVPGMLGSGGTVRVGWWRGTAKELGVSAAVSRGLAQAGHAASIVELQTVDPVSTGALDTILIAPQVGDGDAAEAAGAAAASTLAAFLVASHDVVVVETVSGVGYRYLHGAGLIDLAPPVDASTSQVIVAAPGDAIATGVVSPYLAKAGSVGYPGAGHAVVTDGAADGVVIHVTY
ncbi:MAG: hypothetical protein ABI678_11460 [Kofleriaceae bacterium]